MKSLWALVFCFMICLFFFPGDGKPRRKRCAPRAWKRLTVFYRTRRTKRAVQTLAHYFDEMTDVIPHL